MNSAEKIISQQSSQIYTSHHRIKVLKVHGAKEIFQYNLEFRYQIIVSTIKFRKCFAKFVIPIALFKKFLS